MILWQLQGGELLITDVTLKGIVTHLWLDRVYKSVSLYGRLLYTDTKKAYTNALSCKWLTDWNLSFILHCFMLISLGAILSYDIIGLTQVYTGRAYTYFV